MIVKIILKIYLWYLERQITDEYDPKLSRKIDRTLRRIENE
jgi:hypothetical protein